MTFCEKISLASVDLDKINLEMLQPLIQQFISFIVTSLAGGMHELASVFKQQIMLISPFR